LNRFNVAGICRVILFRFRFADRAEQFPQIQRAYMSSHRTTGACVKRFFANRALFHEKLYLFENHYFKREQ